MIRDVIHPLNAVFFGPGVYEVVTEMSLIVWLSSFWGGMSPQDLLFKAQDSVLGGGMGHRILFQLSSGCFHHCEHMALALAGLWKCDIISLPGLAIFIFHPSSSVPLRLYLLGFLDCSACFTFMDNLCDGVHGKVYPSITSPSVSCISSLVARGVMGPLSYKEFTLMSPVQIHLSHFSLSSLIHLVVVLMFLSGPSPRDMVWVSPTNFLWKLTVS